MIEELKLHLNCGHLIKERFINIDILDLAHPRYFKHDLSKGLPDCIYANSVDFIYQCHGLEHFYPWDRDSLLVSILAKLKPDTGTLRLVLPDFRKMATAYVTNDWNFFHQGLPMWKYAPLGTLCEIANAAAYQYENGVQEHKCLYDAEYTIALLKTFGYKDVKEVPYDTNIDPNTKERELYSFVVEARKP